MAITVMVLLVFTILMSARTTAYHRSDDYSFEPNIFEAGEDCTSDSCLSMFPRKRDGEHAEIMDNSRPLSRVLTSYHITGSPWQLSCPCETRYDIIDLGLDNYPRYLATARCAQKPCFNSRFNQCRLVHYKVHVLRQRDTSIENERSEEQQQYVEQIALPESLGMKWQMKPMKIAVACVANDGRKK